MCTARVAVLCWGLAACSGSDTGETDSEDTATSATDTDTDTDTTMPAGACGDVTQHDLTLDGAVVLASGGPAPEAEVWIEDRAWAAQVEVLGATTTDGEGKFTLGITGLTSVEDCWGTLLDYVVVAELGIQRGEREVNAPLYSAIQDGTYQADIAGSPIEMVDTSL